MTLADLSAFLFPMRTYLVQQNKQLRDDLLVVIANKDVEIRRLRAELQSRGVRMEAEPTHRPARASRFEGDAVPHVPQDWPGELAQMMKEEQEKVDDGI